MASAVLIVAGALVCAGVATYTTVTAPSPSVSIPKTEEKTNAVTTSPQNNYSYWTASIVDGQVVAELPLTYAKARMWVEAGRDLLCKNHSAAIAIVKFYPSARWDHAHGCESAGYLNHYHMSSAHGNHIWYLEES